MLSKTSRKDVAMDKASDLASAVADAAEAGREKIAPVVGNVTGHLSDAAEAAAPHVAKAKETVAEAAAPQVAKAKAATADAATPHVKKAKKAARKASKRASKQAAKNAKKIKSGATDRAATAGLTTEQAHRMFADEWMPRIQETIAATAAAGTSAYAALPQQARDVVETVAPQVAKKRRKKGTVLIALGLLAGAGAVALYVSGQQGGAKRVPQVTAPEIERLDVDVVEQIPAVPASDDAVGNLEKTVDASVSGSRRGRHAAKD